MTVQGFRRPLAVVVTNSTPGHARQSPNGVPSSVEAASERGACMNKPALEMARCHLEELDMARCHPGKMLATLPPCFPAGIALGLI